MILKMKKRTLPVFIFLIPTLPKKQLTGVLVTYMGVLKLFSALLENCELLRIVDKITSPFGNAETLRVLKTLRVYDELVLSPFLSMNDYFANIKKIIILRNNFK